MPELNRESSAQHAAFLETRVQETEDYLQSLTHVLSQCRGADDAQAASLLMPEISAMSLRFLARQQQAWQEHPHEGAGSASSSDPTPHAEHSVADRLARLAAMGGTPALGGMALPKLSQDQLHGLSSTISPAARELHAAKGHSAETAPVSPPNIKTPDANSPPWLVELRAKKQGSRPSSPPRP